MGCGASAEAVPFSSTVVGELVNCEGNKAEAAALLEGKVKLVLFSANIPGPADFALCRLKPLYNELKAKGVAFEVVFVSDDSTEDNFKKYLDMMPWWAVPYIDVQRRSGLRYVLGVQGPALVVLSASDEIITVEGMQEVQQDPRGEKFPWRPSKVGGLMDAMDELAG